MNGPSIVFSDVNARQGVFHRRALLMGGLSTLGLGALSARLVDLQVIDSQKYASLAEGNQFQLRSEPPPRGRILDRNGVVLAGNRSTLTVLVTRDETKDLDQTLDALGMLLPSTVARRRVLVRQINEAQRSAPVAVATDLSWEEFARVNLHQSDVPGLSAEMSEARYYPFGGAFAHVVGYVSKVSEKDIDEAGDDSRDIMLDPSFRIGKQGVEKSLDLELRGKPGALKVMVDAHGRKLSEDTEQSKPPTPGKDVILTLDADIQNRALDVFADDSGAAVMIDVRNGDILCMTSAPAFDANMFVSGAPRQTYEALSQYERQPLLDKALTGLYPPGSTFKTMTALAALSQGFDPHRTFTCSGSMQWGGRTWNCWIHGKGGHGAVDMHNAIKTSCDIYFYNVALLVGPDPIAKAATAFGFGQIFDIGIPGQKKGTVPSTEWKRKTQKQPWYAGESLSYGIGQGALQVNALQLAVMTSRLANSRKAINPRLIKSVGGVERPSGAEVPDLPFPQEHLDIVRGGMQAVANDTSGTAYRQSQLNLGSLAMAGKSGTAQVRHISDAEHHSGVLKNQPWKLRDHGIFVAFAPYDDPRYAVAVVVQHGVAGAKFAAPKAREIMKVALLKDPDMRKRIETPLTGVTPDPAPGSGSGDDEPDTQPLND